MPDERAKGEEDFVLVRIGPLGVFTCEDVSFLVSRIGIVISDSLSLAGVFRCLMK